MPKSDAFIRIKAQVLQITAAVPEGKVCTYQSIGEHLDVMARHVAYILAQLDESAKMAYPWHRIIAADGTLGVTKRSPDGRTQSALLRLDGVSVDGNAVRPDLAAYFVPADKLDHGLPRQRRPSVRPTPRAPRSPRKA